MSKQNVFELFKKSATDEHLQEQLQAVSHPDELVQLGQQQGFAFSAEHVEEALSELKQKPGFFRALAEAALAVFSPTHDDYPATGVQPFSGETPRKH
jgi:predicted ribosomally synthesized peptide with nif11-like leader